MNKSLALKNKFFLFFLLTISFFIFFYSLYFLINGERGIISYYKIKNLNTDYISMLSNYEKKNNLLIDKVKRLQSNSLDLDFLDSLLFGFFFSFLGFFPLAMFSPLINLFLFLI